MSLYPGTATSPVIARRLAEVRALGASTVALVMTWSAADVRATAIAPSKRTIPDRAAIRAIAMAHSLGLEVVVFPILTLDTVAPGQWRGTMQPADGNRFWLAYEAFILHYAQLAARTGAEALMVGSELGSTEAWRGRWYHLISKVEGVFSGALYYSANWDHYEHVSFWPRVDAVGITGYFSVAGSASASEAELLRAWRRIRERLRGFAAAHQKPLFITELGYPSTDGAARWPWDYTRAGQVDLEEQRRAFAAFALAFSEAPLFGVLVWAWDGPGGPGDGGYTPRGKPAASVLFDYFSGTRGTPNGGSGCAGENATPRSVGLDHTTRPPVTVPGAAMDTASPTAK